VIDFGGFMHTKITLGRLLKIRQIQGISQRELAEMFNKYLDSESQIDWKLISKLENDRLDVCLPEFDWVIPIIVNVFGDTFDREYLEQIRQQTTLRLAPTK
jgi:transcriptional regulator with XRE-family HTH domain